ncbi:wax ester/triacylglycerol synthase family O-acyltransferase [Rhodococcus sp. NPDC127528]|uniref:WS/DGAT/MGAT family O-acyltransferase n=1 Tax=unclassified Rhodococcus (in: high G+C Gram-positive bacteria) TaxID=192944 RepID=UPI00363ACF43
MERLSGLDSTFLYLETPTQLLHVCGLIVLDVSTIPGGYSFADFESELAARVRGMPGFRRKLFDSKLNLDHPAWVEDTDFDISRHLHRIAVPAPGGRAELAELCGHIASQRMDRTIPLWEMWVIEGLEDGSVAIMSKMHHANVDGVTGASMMAQLCSLTPDAPRPEPDPDQREVGRGNTLDLALGGLIGFATRPLKIAQALPGGITLLPKWIRRARRGEAMPAPFTAPRTSLNGAITGHRNIAYSQLDLDKVKLVKNAFDVKVNDVVLATVAGALRTYLADRDELPESSLVAMVPVSVHETSDRPGTNQISGMFTQLGTQIADPVERLKEANVHNTMVKSHNADLGASLLQDWSQFAAPTLFGGAMRVYGSLSLAERHPVVSNLVVSNVPGPPVPLYFLGAHIKAMYPLGPIFHGAGLNVTVMSLDGKLNVGLVSCRELAPELRDLADAFGPALDELVKAARAKTRKRTRAAVQK